MTAIFTPAEIEEIRAQAKEESQRAFDQRASRRS